MNILRQSRMFLAVLLCVGLLLAIDSATDSAEKWYLVDEWQGRKIEVDDDSLSLFDGNNRIQCYSRVTQNNIYAVSLTYVDFLNRSYAIGETKMFDSTGKITHVSPGDPEKYEPIQKNTLGERLYYSLEAYRDAKTLPKPRRVENGR
ncbi:MAG: hypothetical protein AB9917_07350 [Negativicutes bacterium]